MFSPSTSHKYDRFIIFISARTAKISIRNPISFFLFPRKNYYLGNRYVARFVLILWLLYSEGGSVLWAYLFRFGNVVNETGRVDSLGADLAWAWAAVCLTPLSCVLMSQDAGGEMDTLFKLKGHRASPGSAVKELEAFGQIISQSHIIRLSA